MLTFSDGYTQRMRLVRPLADQDMDVLLQAMVDAGLVRMVEERTADDEPGMQEPAQQSQQAGPSFNCAKASTAIEGMICGNAELASLDARAAKAYKLVRDGADDRAAMQREQVQWIKQTRNACKSVECLTLAYSERAEDLERVARYLSKPAAFR